MWGVTAEGPTGVPARGGHAMGAALVPVPAQIGEAYQSWGKVCGSPGTIPIPAPRPDIPMEGINHVGGGQALHFSYLQPLSWRPGVYYQPKLPSRFHGALDSDNQMPVPARTPDGRYGFVTTGKPAVLARTPRFTRDRQVAWPITLPDYGGQY